jgi:hypothetical protein
VSTVAHEGRPPADFAPRPSWRDAFVATIVGWVTAAGLVLVPILVAFWLGLVGRSGAGGLGGEGLRDWPYPRNGDLSLLANTVVWLELLALTALVVRAVLADRVGPVSAVPIFVVLAVTGFVPLLPRGLLDMPFLVAFLASALLMRAAVATTPIRPLPRRITVQLIAACALLLAVPAWYGLKHPLWYGSVVGETVSDPPLRSTLGEHTFGLRNAGFADVRVDDVSLALEAPVATLVDVRADRDLPVPPGSPFPASPRPPFMVPARGEMFVQLRLRERGCGGPVRGAAVVRYRLLGVQRVTRIPVRVPVGACASG